MTMRWYGEGDPIPLEHIGQVPGVRGVVGSMFDIPPGVPWRADAVRSLRSRVEASGLALQVIESIPVHEAIKLGSHERDEYIEAYQDSVRAVARAGVEVLCYNFMPIFDWTRTDVAWPLPDGSTTLCYEQDQLDRIDVSSLDRLPAWANHFSIDEIVNLAARFRELGPGGLHENLAYFLRAVVPVAAEAGVRMALHPDDPPWPLFGIPRIVTDAANIERILDAVPDVHNGLTLCTGSLGCAPDNDLPAMARRFAGRIHFVHARNVRKTGERSFVETPHPSEYGDVDMYEVVRALVETGFDGPIRSDHGRMIWGETGRPGYGLYDRALGAAYLNGLIEAVRKAVVA